MSRWLAKLICRFSGHWLDSTKLKRGTSSSGWMPTGDNERTWLCDRCGEPTNVRVQKDRRGSDRRRQERRRS